MIFKIPETNLQYATEQIEKLQKRAEKIGAPAVTLTVVHELFEILRQDGKDVTVKFCIIDVQGPAPKINGWTFAATIIHEDGGNIFHVNPEFEATIPVEYRTAPSSNCDHCHTQRIRKDTYVLRSEDGKWIQVGRSCLRDFLGHANPEQIAQYAERIMNLSNIFEPLEECEYRGNGMRMPNYAPLTSVLNQSARFVRVDGYVSKAKAEEYNATSTASSVSYVLFPWHTMSLEDRIKFEAKYGAQPTEADADVAKKAIDWAKDLEVEADNDYLWNIRTIANSEYVQERNIGLACSIIIAYLKAMTKLESKNGNGFADEFYGTEGTKFEAQAKLVFLTSYETDWGTTHVYTFNIDNKKVTWKTQTNAFGPADIGTVFQLKGKVKSHGIYKDKKQTLVERVKVLESNVKQID